LHGKNILLIENTEDRRWQELQLRYWGFFANLITEHTCKAKYFPLDMLKPFLSAQQSFCLIGRKHICYKGHSIPLLKG